MSSITVCLRILILALCLSGFPGLAADAVVDAEEFSSDELSRLRESQRPDLLLGGGIQAQPQNDLGLALLEEAAAAGQPHPAVLATLLERLLSRMYIKIPTPDLDARIDDAISRLSRVSTPNALPGLVEAVVSAQRGRGT